MSDLKQFVLDFCRVSGWIVEPPAYGAFEVLLPDAVARQLGLAAFQRIAFDDGAPEDATHLTYAHPLVEQMAESARATPACTRFFINDVRLDKPGLADLARESLTFPNAHLYEVPRAPEGRALFHYLQVNFKAALITDEKREQMVLADRIEWNIPDEDDFIVLL